MRTETTRIFTDLLSLHGHLSDPVPTPQEEGTTMNLFKSFWLLGGLESIDPRVEDEATGFNPSYGNRLANARDFGTIARAANATQRAPIVADDQRVAHC